jgi:hypothetical protein
MGAGLAEVGVLLVLTIVGLPLFLFALLAALDRFEQSLSAEASAANPAAAAVTAPEPLTVIVPAATEHATADAAVVALPIATAVSASSRTAAAI